MSKLNSVHLGVHTPAELITLLKNYSLEQIKNYSETLNQPRFRTRETGISRRDISVWKREGLLPNNDTTEISWNEFSLIECIWLRLVAKLKKFGCDNAFISEFKEQAFSQKAKDYRNVYDSTTKSTVQDKNADGALLKFKAQIDAITDSELEKILKEGNYSLFGNLIMSTCLFKMNTAILFFEDEFSFLNIGSPLNKAHEINVASVIKQLSTRSFIAVNIMELCSSFFENEQLHIDNEYYWGIMNRGERKVLDEIRSGKVKQVTVKVKDGSITHIKPMRDDRENEDMIRKISRLIKKGEYKQIEFITRDGKVIKYEETDILKM